MRSSPPRFTSAPTLSPAATTTLSPFAAPQPELVASPHLEVDHHRLIIPKNLAEEREKVQRSEQSEEIHSAARRLRRRLPKRVGAKEAGELLRLEQAFSHGKPLITSTRTLLLLHDDLLVSTPENRSDPRPAVLAICSDVLVIGLKLPHDAELYFDYRLEGQRIIKLSRCEVSQDPESKAIHLSTPLTSIIIHSTSSDLFPTLLTHLSPAAPATLPPLTPPASPSLNCSSPTSPTSSTSSKTPNPTRRRAPPPSSFHTRPVSQISAHSARSVGSVSSIRSVSSFRASWEPVWVPDEECEGCMVCGEAWGWKRRRHHCRACGRLICHACSSFRPSIFGSTKPMRACVTCVEAIDREDSEDEDAEMGYVHARNHAREETGMSETGNPGLGIWGEGEGEGSEDEGTVRGAGDEDGLGQVREEAEEEEGAK